MGKYKNLQDDVFSIFGASTWEAENIKTYPADMVALNTQGEYLRIDIIPSGEGVNLGSTSGILMIDIFTSAGNGPNRATLLADKLDEYLVGRSLSTVSGNVTQFFDSAMEFRGRDPDNKSLSRSVYSIPFNFNGVS